MRSEGNPEDQVNDETGGLDATRAATGSWKNRSSRRRDAEGLTPFLEPVSRSNPQPQQSDRAGADAHRDDAADGDEALIARDDLADVYDSLVDSASVGWKMDYELIRAIGQGGQGIVYLVDRYGAYNTRFRLALKFFSPRVYRTVADYHADMSRLARVAVRLTKLQHDNLLDVHNVVSTQGIDVQTMEWIDGVDLRRLLGLDALESIRGRVSSARWDELNDVVATPAGGQLRFKPGVAIAIARRCLAGLGALHGADIIHGDVKPANVMIKRTGSLKLIDLGSAFSTNEPPRRQAWTPRYAAVEVMNGKPPGPRSDLASLGYVLVEMLTGELPFANARNHDDLIEQKLALPNRLKEVLPPDGDASLRQFVRKLIDPDPNKRFQSAEEAEMSDEGAVAFLRQLVKGDLDSEYENELRNWLVDLMSV